MKSSSLPVFQSQCLQNHRNSSIELYRIIATITVLIVHFNGWFVGGMPERLDIGNLTTYRFGQAFIESATCICVNMFLLISGYFGIKLKWISVAKIWLLLLFIYVPFYLIQALFEQNLRLKDFVYSFFVLSKSGYFVQCYLMLMFLSPVLNSFIEKQKENLAKWTLGLIIVEFWFGEIMQLDCLGFGAGYSVMHFVLMYMIARCVYLNKEKLMRIKNLYWIVGYFICTVIILLLYVLGIRWTFNYSNPIVIISSICTFMPFVYHSFHNKIINWIASSTLAVYIIQVTNPVYKYLVEIDQYLLANYSYRGYLLTVIGVILASFMFFILYDKVCQLGIQPIMNRIKNIIEG